MTSLKNFVIAGGIFALGALAGKFHEKALNLHNIETSNPIKLNETFSHNEQSYSEKKK